ncbi:hypothetical protein [Pedobacter sp. R-06]|uniref:hypothetical protein n=1 Tax=Pedobacter sp. R-06 TaxID=3404051 RepID=UPI003CE748AE
MPKSLTYKNTRTSIIGQSIFLHEEYPRGYAYEGKTHFIHYFGLEHGFYEIPARLTVIQEKSGSLEDWVKSEFGAEDIEEMETEVGAIVKGVWRPSLRSAQDVYEALDVTEQEMRLSENALRLLINKLDDIFLYIEPAVASQHVYSHKTRELLILACTELENFWQYYAEKSGLSGSGKRLTTNDYARLCQPLHLKEYQFTLNTYAGIPPIRPFEHWDIAKPTASLAWYDAYNNTKHDREKHFSQATLFHCISAVVACLVMHCVKFSPYQMFGRNNTFSAIINQHFKGSLVNVNYRSFYLFQVNPEHEKQGEYFRYVSSDGEASFLFRSLNFTV